MNRALIRFWSCAVTACAVYALSAQEAASTDGGAAADTGAATEGIDPALVKAATEKPSARFFHVLVRLARVEGAEVEVRLPREKEFRPATEGKFYANGSTFRVTGGATGFAEFEFGKDSVLKVTGDAEFSTREVEIGAQARTVMPVRGAFTVSLPRTLPTGLFAVAYPTFTAKDLAGESRHELTPTGDGDEAVVHVITGILAIEGAHYKVERMNAADRLRIRTTGDALFTSLRGEAGDCKVSLDQGCTSYTDPISGEVKSQDRRLEFSLSPQCAIKIFRKRSQVGGRMAVSVMTFDPAGEMRNRFTFAEGTASVNFGEEVVRIQDISFKTDKDKKDAAQKKEGEAGAGESGGETSGGESSSGGETSGGESSSGGETSGGGESNAGGVFGDNT